MAPEPTKDKLKCRASRSEIEEYRFDGGHAREIEQKRSNGQISCAECRRLKIKCDKQIPCQSCQRRGCAALCPNGSLSTGQGTRFVLAATKHLHRRITKMSERIRQLEDALCDLQSQHSTEPHPLLCEDLLGVKHKDDEPYIPPDKSGTVSHPPEVILSAVETWNYRFSAECVAEVAERTLTAEIPSYATIMELDRKVREFPVPEFPTHVTSSVAGPVPTITTEDLSISEFMGRFAMAYTREVLLLYIHRSFFAQAIIENPVNPLKSQYTPSFLASYRAASTILRTIGAQYAQFPDICAQFWSIWMTAFSAAIVFGTIVIRGPRSPLASNAIRELDETCVLFTKVANHNRRAAKALPILTKLSQKAHNALAACQNEESSGQLGQQCSLPEPVPQLYCPETSTSSVDSLARTEQDQLLCPATHAEHVNASVQPHDMSQRQPLHPTPPPHPTPSPPVSTSQLHPAPQHTAHGHSTVTTPSYSWAQQSSGASSQFRSAAYSAENWSQLHGYPDHPHAYEQSSAPPHQKPRPQQSQQSQTQATESAAPSDEHSTSTTTSCSWAQQSVVSSQFSPATYSAENWSQSHGYEQSFAPPCQQPWPQLLQQLQTQSSQWEAPPELTELGLVSQESRLDERWTSFMRDSGYFEGFGY